MAKAETAESQWYLVDAKNKTLGRLASELAKRLRGKHKPEFTPHVLCGDSFIVVNVKQLRVTGNKREDKLYHHYSGYPSGLKTFKYDDMMDRSPERILMLAVKGMLPKGPLGRRMLRNLKVYADDQHPHHAQQPKPLEL